MADTDASDENPYGTLNRQVEAPSTERPADPEAEAYIQQHHDEDDEGESTAAEEPPQEESMGRHEPDKPTVLDQKEEKEPTTMPSPQPEPEHQQQQHPTTAVAAAEEEEEDEGSFWHRFASIPIVQDSVGKVQQYPLGRYALKQAETTWSKASTQAGSLPYAQAYFEKAGALGCLSLDVLEQRFPAVYQPTDQIVDSVKRSSNHVRDCLLTTVKAPVHHAVSLVDRLLWSQQQQQQQQQQQHDGDKDELTHLSETKALLQETAHHIARINDSLRGWTACVASQVKSQIKGSYESTQAECNHRILELTTELVTKLDTASAYAKTVPIPPIIQAKMGQLVEFYDAVRSETVKEDLSPMQKAARVVLITQGCILPALHTSIDGIQEQIKYYAAMSKGKVVGEIKGQLNSLGIHASS
ncbi:hypothetical protein BDB00DRAFT_810794 [Zychaea mexicana]|uniref:uncharacterized protein n=1 Tax=Zychaea mexicana TaxID=64656 RepID=UPI0022FF3A4F|nr:uncharacterized protein BDB00DRAFT_810794 [Zychaea mexicana]KAI9496171.1 hypothetical protein BDB00DRAFT_810794 [Zychaea mexicana]